MNWISDARIAGWGMGDAFLCLAYQPLEVFSLPFVSCGTCLVSAELPTSDGSRITVWTYIFIQHVHDIIIAATYR